MEPTAMFGSLYLLLAGVLVLLMVAGMSLFSAGMIRRKNINTLLAKSIAGITVACLVYLGIGYQIMFLGGNDNLLIPGFAHLFSWGRHWSHFFNDNLASFDIAQAFFQFTLVGLVIAIIAAVSAERLKLWSLILFAIFFAGLIYPIEGYWLRGGGFLQHLGFIDQAGAAMVHLTGASAALAAVIVLRGRQGKYRKGQKVRALPGSNMPFAVFGTLLFWVGCLGFNSAYLVSVETYDVVRVMATVFLNTMTAAAASAFIMLILNHIFLGKIDITLLLNAVMIGLVAISAAPMQATLTAVVIIGAVAGLLCFFSVLLLERMRLDDPVGGLSVHGVGAMWGLIAAPSFIIYREMPTQLLKQLIIQLDGVAVILLWGFISSIIVWALVKLLIGLRASHEEEQEGVDWFNCGYPAYPEME